MLLGSGSHLAQVNPPSVGLVAIPDREAWCSERTERADRKWSGIVTVQSGTPFSVANGVLSDNAGAVNGVSVNSAQSDPRLGINNFPFDGLDRCSTTPRLSLNHAD